MIHMCTAVRCTRSTARGAGRVIKRNKFRTCFVDFNDEATGRVRSDQSVPSPQWLVFRASSGKVRKKEKIIARKLKGEN